MGGPARVDTGEGASTQYEAARGRLRRAADQTGDKASQGPNISPSARLPGKSGNGSRQDWGAGPAISESCQARCGICVSLRRDTGHPVQGCQG